MILQKLCTDCRRRKKSIFVFAIGIALELPFMLNDFSAGFEYYIYRIYQKKPNNLSLGKYKLKIY